MTPTPLNAQAVFTRLLALRAGILASFTVYALYISTQNGVLFYLGFIIVLSALFSILSWQYRHHRRLTANRLVLSQLLWDSATILFFVWLAGRSTNPFIYYQLLIVAISASILPASIAWGFSTLGIAAYSLLLYADMAHHTTHLDASFKAHLIGMWVNFSGSALLIAFSVSKLSAALRNHEIALRQAREDNLKNEQLIGLGTLAASTVHSFGTPLATITMAASELEALHPDPETRVCTQLIKMQIDRCKTTMQKLTALSTKKALNEHRIGVAVLLQDIKDYLLLSQAEPMPTLSSQAAIAEWELPGGLLLEHALINLIDNALGVAHQHVAISVSCAHYDPAQKPQSREASNSFVMCIEDDGGGIYPQTARLTEHRNRPYEKGLGIGLLLANSTIERLGGSVSYCNPTASDPLTRITVTLPCTMPDSGMPSSDEKTVTLP